MEDHICIDSWYQYYPNFEIRHWHEESPELLVLLPQSRFLRDCCQYKIWPMVADYFRAWLLYTYGGIYLDTDILLFNSLDSLLQENFFISNFTSDQQGII